VRYTTFTRSVIGKAGATINTIKEASGARVKVSSNQEFFPGTNERIILVSSLELELPQYPHQSGKCLFCTEYSASSLNDMLCWHTAAAVLSAVLDILC